MLLPEDEQRLFAVQQQIDELHRIFDKAMQQAFPNEKEVAPALLAVMMFAAELIAKSLTTAVAVHGAPLEPLLEFKRGLVDKTVEDVVRSIVARVRRLHHPQDDAIVKFLEEEALWRMYNAESPES